MGSGEAAVNAALSNAALGDRNYPVTWWSVYITKGNADLPLLYFHRFNAWLTIYAVKGAGSTGGGDKKGQLHLQAIVCLHCPPDNFGSCLIRDSIKTEFPIPTGAGYRVDAKPFAPTQWPPNTAGFEGHGRHPRPGAIHLSGSSYAGNAVGGGSSASASFLRKKNGQTNKQKNFYDLLPLLLYYYYCYYVQAQHKNKTKKKILCCYTLHAGTQLLYRNAVIIHYTQLLLV